MVFRGYAVVTIFSRSFHLHPSLRIYSCLPLDLSLSLLCCVIIVRQLSLSV
jgi:hypothetical protein